MDVLEPQPATYDAVPDEVWALVFQRLSVREIARCTEVCRLWNNVIKRDASSWRPYLTDSSLYDPRSSSASITLRARLHNYIRYLRDGSFTDFVDHRFARPYRVARLLGNVVQGLFLLIFAASMFMLQSPTPVLLGFMCFLMVNGVNRVAYHAPRYAAQLLVLRDVVHVALGVVSLVGLLWSGLRYGFSLDSLWIDAFALSMQTSPTLFKLGNSAELASLCKDCRFALGRWFDACARSPCLRHCHCSAFLDAVLARIGCALERLAAVLARAGVLDALGACAGAAARFFVRNVLGAVGSAFVNVWLHFGSLLQSSHFSFPSGLVGDSVIVASCAAACGLFVWYFYWPIYLVLFTGFMFYAFITPAVALAPRFRDDAPDQPAEEDFALFLVFAGGAIVLRLWLWLFGGSLSFGLQIALSAAFWWAQTHMFMNLLGGRFEAAYTIIFWVLAPLRFWLLIPASAILLCIRVFGENLGSTAVRSVQLLDRKSPLARLHDGLRKLDDDESPTAAAPSDAPSTDAPSDAACTAASAAASTVSTASAASAAADASGRLARYRDTPAVQRVISLQTLRRRWGDVAAARVTSFLATFSFTTSPLGMVGDSLLASGLVCYDVAAGALASYRAMPSSADVQVFPSGCVGSTFVALHAPGVASIIVHSLPHLFPIDELVGVSTCGVFDTEVLFAKNDVFFVKSYPTQVEREVEFEGMTPAGVVGIALGRLYAGFIVAGGSIRLYDRRTGGCRYTTTDSSGAPSIRFGSQFAFVSARNVVEVIDMEAGVALSTSCTHRNAAFVEPELGFGLYIESSHAFSIVDLLDKRSAAQVIDVGRFFEFAKSAPNPHISVVATPTRIVVAASAMCDFATIIVIDLLYDGDGDIDHTGPPL